MKRKIALAPFLLLATPFYADLGLDNWRILEVDVVWLIVCFAIGTWFSGNPERDK